MIHISNISKHYGSKSLFREGSFQINKGEKIGLVGPNGAGKTTLLRVLAGEERLDEGKISRPEKITMAYFSQNIIEASGRSALEEVKSALPQMIRFPNRMAEIEKILEEGSFDNDAQQMENILTEYGELQNQFEQLGGYEWEAQASEILTGLGIGPDQFHLPIEQFSGGWKMRIMLAKVLLLNPELLLMDEPTNHLDLESIIWLESWLKTFSGALLMTCHDREFMNRVVHKIVEVSHQQITVYSGNYDFFVHERKMREEKLLASAQRQQEMLAKEKDFISRFAARASHAAQVQSRIKKIEKIDLIEIPPEERTVNFIWPEPIRGGDEVLKLNDLGKTWVKDPSSLHSNEDRIVFKHATALIKRLDRVALVGVNGAGKSTLMKVIVGQTLATEGKCTVGANIQVGYFSQNSLDVLNPHHTVLGEMEHQFPHADLGYLRNILGAFLFSGDDVEKKVSVLSGGEKSRLVLAALMMRAPNFLVLDEPTNHLDIKTREVLLSAFKVFPGTLLMVSHDRYFLRELTTRVFELNKQELHIYEGTWDYYLEKSGRI